MHLPVQEWIGRRSMEAMNRKHTVDDYLRVIEKLRAMHPDIAFVFRIFIIGFPGETDKDFAATMRLARGIGFAQAYSF